MAKRDRTSMGGENERFRTTHWTEIHSVRTADEARRREVLEQVVASYWKPIYCYLRRKGCSNDDAKDLTQGFFQEIVLGRDLVGRADRDKGRFRTFLLTALDRYATSVHRAKIARRRMPAGGILSLDGGDSAACPEPAHSGTPQEAFNFAWASELLDRVLAEVASECERSGKTTHWMVFRERVLRPIMENVEAPPLADLCTELGVEDEAKASNMIVTVKRRFQAALRRQVRQFVDCEEAVDQEISELMGILASGGAGLP